MIKIEIQSDADFTPVGKRTARAVTLRSGPFGPVQRIRWYVSGRIYRTLTINAANVSLTKEWMAA